MYPCLEVVLFVTKSFQMNSVCVHSLKLYQSSNCSLKDSPGLVCRDAWKVSIRELATLRKNQSKKINLHVSLPRGRSWCPCKTSYINFVYITGDLTITLPVYK